MTIVVCTVLTSWANGNPDRVFRVASEIPDRIVFTVHNRAPKLSIADADMGRVLAGVLAVEVGQASVARVGRLIERRTRPRESTEIKQSICIAWLYSSEADETDPRVKRVEIGRTADDWIIAEELDDEGDGVDLARLSDVRFAEFSADWPRFRGSFGAPPVEPLGRMVELTKPYVAARITLDSDVLRQRIYGRAPTEVPPLDRDLATERMFIRLPSKYRPDRPAGVLVWIHAVNSGQQPLDVFGPGLDELGLICVSVENAGNTRQIVDRLQLMLDAVETVGARYLIDETRIYATGISGGGRSSSMLWACFPDVFTGAVPIVGLNSYDLAPTGTGQAWPKNFIKPRGRAWSLLRTHRLAAITGRNDFNEPEMKVRINAMARDGLNVRLVDQPEMAHEMPTAETFAFALAWVDEAADLAAAEREANAVRLLDRVEALSGEARNRVLRKIIETAPWSEVAFAAIDRIEKEAAVQNEDKDATDPED